MFLVLIINFIFYVNLMQFELNVFNKLNAF